MKNLKIVVTGRLLKHINVVASNGETILSSETYFSESNARKAAHKLAGATGWKLEVK